MDGLAYMHSEETVGNFHKEMICHGDLKGVGVCSMRYGSMIELGAIQGNYLVELDESIPRPTITGKITDFGLSAILGSTKREGSSLVSEAVRWQAPELAPFREDDFAGREKHLEKADVWSFALTALEVRDPSPFLL
jgi:serine/threonine protein kinase